MRYSLLTLLAFIYACNLIEAQDHVYLPIAVEGANWIIQNSEMDDSYLSFVHSIEGDTTVEGRSYKKVFRRTIDHTQETSIDPPLSRPYGVLPGRELILLMRDDIEARRVLGRIVSAGATGVTVGPDTLLHDYSLGVGDTLIGLNFDDFGAPSIISEVIYENRYGAERRVQIVNGHKYYEGVGSAIWGPTSGPSLTVATGIFNLFDYCLGDLPDCQVWLTPVINIDQTFSIKTQPNPFTTRLNFLPNGTATGEPVTVSLRDVTGRLLRRGILDNGLEWNTDDLAPGLYLVTFVNGTRRGTVKVVKR